MPIGQGQMLLQYRVGEKIGEGGMGVVWRALDTSLRREVAIKVLSEPLSHHGETLARFDREAKLLASLNHSNIAAIYGFHREAGICFLVMELVEGETLAHRLRRGPLPPDETLDVCRQIAEALESAHEHGIVHRDLKPANVKLAPGGKVKVLDFGLAKAVASDAAAGSVDLSLSPTLTSDGTRDGVVLGTAAYMSPQQARGHPVDQRTDLWSFGCVLFECLTGTQLFRGETPSDTLAAILRKDPDWSELPADTPPRVRLLLRRCLARDPRQRLQSAGDARLELEEAIKGLTADLAAAGEAAPRASALTRWLPWAVAALAVLVAIGLAGRGAAPSPEPRMVRRLTIPVPGPTTAFGEVMASPPALSPDGRMVVFGVEERGGKVLWLRPLEDFTARRLEGTQGALYPFWSPDSRHVGYFRGGRLHRFELATGRAQPIGGEGSVFPRGASWGARGQIIFAPTANSGIYAVDAAGGEARQVTVVDPEIPDGSADATGDHQRFLVATREREAGEPLHVILDWRADLR